VGDSLSENDLIKRRKVEALTQKGCNLSYIGQYTESLPFFDEALALPARSPYAP
jgi:hypothetical protein